MLVFDQLYYKNLDEHFAEYFIIYAPGEGHGGGVAGDPVTGRLDTRLIVSSGTKTIEKSL